MTSESALSGSQPVFRPVRYVTISLVFFVLVSGVLAGCRPWKSDVTPNKDNVVKSILDSSELELRALEALEIFSESGEDSDLEEAKELIQHARDFLRDASKEWASLYAKGAISKSEWNAVRKELKCARLNDTRAEAQIMSESFVIEDVMERIEVALNCKKVAIELI